MLIPQGQFSINMYDGKGKYYVTNDVNGEEISRLKYEGEFKSGSYHGTGKIYFADIEDVDANGNESPYLMYSGEFKMEYMKDMESDITQAKDLVLK